MENMAWDIVLQNNSFFTNNDFNKVLQELNNSSNPKRTSAYLKYNIGSNEEEYNKWKGLPILKKEKDYTIVPARNNYSIPDYEVSILIRQEIY